MAKKLDQISKVNNAVHDTLELLECSVRSLKVTESDWPVFYVTSETTKKEKFRGFIYYNLEELAKEQINREKCIKYVVLNNGLSDWCKKEGIKPKKAYTEIGIYLELNNLFSFVSFLSGSKNYTIKQSNVKVYNYRKNEKFYYISSAAKESKD